MAVRQMKLSGGNGVEQAVVHVRYAGRSFDVPIVNLDLAAGANDAQVKRALGGWLEVGEAKLRDYVIDRHANGNMTLRPEAVFG
jgi:hypothetical protein